MKDVLGVGKGWGSGFGVGGLLDEDVVGDVSSRLL
jgi:hypothetical protein